MEKKKEEGGSPMLSVEKVLVTIQYCINTAAVGCTEV